MIIKQVAIYSLYGRGEYVKEVADLTESDKDYTRLTEPVDVEMEELPEEVVHEGLITSCQARMDDARAKYLQHMALLDEEMANLRALPAPEQD